MLKKILIANRSEIAVRIARACTSLDIASVAVFERRDRGALHVTSADESIELEASGGVTAYLDAAALVDAALRAGADAVHPGYGFLAESAAFARAVTAAGLTWIGPRPETISALGDKNEARRIAIEAGLVVVPGSDGIIGGPEDVVALGRAGGWPVVVKASLGGGGRGMRVVTAERDAPQLVAAARREALKAFGDDSLLAERYVVGARHVEVQIVADEHGSVMAVGDRECSVQRRHQKLIEEAPASSVPDWVRAELAHEAEAIMRHVGYVGAGTVEFLVVGDEHFFLEVNTRIQVEHPVTEMVSGLDLVAEQIRIASGEPLSVSSPPAPRGHAIEVRVNAEDPFRGFAPASGRLDVLSFATETGGRIDAGYRSGDVVPPDFDSLIAKIVVHEADRSRALRQMARVLWASSVAGVPTTLPALADVVGHVDFASGDITTAWFEQVVEPTLLPDDERAYRRDVDLVEVGGALIRVVRPPGTARPERRSSRARGPAGEGASGDGAARSPMTGTVLAVHVAAGDAVALGDPLATIEAMKMENVVRSEAAGIVGAVDVAIGDAVRPGRVLMTMVAESSAD